MNDVMKIFSNDEFGNIRAVEIDGEPWFYGSDVAEVLGYAKPRNAIKEHVWDEDKNTASIQGGIPGNPNRVLINESGVYRLVFNSKLKSARKFSHWITHEVLPSIRKHGMYISPELLKDKETLIKEIEKLKEENQKLLESKKISYKEYVENRKYEACSTATVAGDFDLSARKLNKILETKNIQYKDEYGKWNLCDEYKDKDYTVTSKYDYGFGYATTLKWTKKGCIFIAEILRNLPYPITPVVEREGEKNNE